jgi:hypothetical protein
LDQEEKRLREDLKELGRERITWSFFLALAASARSLSISASFSCAAT